MHVLEDCYGSPIRRVTTIACMYVCGSMLAVWVHTLIISVYSLLHVGIGSNRMLLVCSGLVVY